jgi:hypothetical protein
MIYRRLSDSGTLKAFGYGTGTEWNGYGQNSWWSDGPVNAEGDYSFGQNKQNFVNTREAVGQAVKTRLKLLYSEWWEDIEDGLPLFEQILAVPATGNNKQLVDKIVQDRIQNTLNVTGISTFQSVFDSKTRTYTFTCNIDTVYGQINIGDVTF